MCRARATGPPSLPRHIEARWARSSSSVRTPSSRPWLRAGRDGRARRALVAAGHAAVSPHRRLSPSPHADRACQAATCSGGEDSTPRRSRDRAAWAYRLTSERDARRRRRHGPSTQATASRRRSWPQTQTNTAAGQKPESSASRANHPKRCAWTRRSAAHSCRSPATNVRAGAGWRPPPRLRWFNGPSPYAHWQVPGRYAREVPRAGPRLAWFRARTRAVRVHRART